ncbi:cob(II)yrinic acid a,c-diamide reductase [Motilibacter rhizosphaerae]|uniref:Nicotinate-nucleotide--dimethylbenzimidazole phosphoribosyltransferase n=1 Tax=Motilibacter rhizosphaerae TaxID=598652 RepID=A0A4Q7NXH9_9ACTN|nr:cob(II)yrinic acid a,c-diamide reductase [Motilibacter rhizosphaerae]
MGGGAYCGAVTWSRPVPLVGDATSARERAADPAGWRFPDEQRAAFYAVLGARRDVRRFRPDPVPDEVLERVLAAGHAAPSVGHSQPWRFVVVDDPAVRERAAVLADRERLAQAAQLDEESGRRLLDLQLEGVREAPLGVVVACDRRAPAAGVLGRATFPDADLWSCACAIENLWLAARAEGLGLGWVTLFGPHDLAGLVGLPEGVVTLGWLCLGWPDERPPAPGLERAAWSARLPLSDVVVRGRWPGGDAPAAPRSRLRAPDQEAVVAARDSADDLLAAPGALGVLERAADRATALGWAPPQDGPSGTLLLAVGRHPVAALGVTAYEPQVGDDVLAAAREGVALGPATARAAGLSVEVVDAGTATGDLLSSDPLEPDEVDRLLAHGRELGARLAGLGLVALGEVGIGNTTPAAALAAALLGLPPEQAVGQGSGSDTGIVERKREVVATALDRYASRPAAGTRGLLAALGGPEIALLCGVVTGAAGAGGLVVLDGLATGVAALLAVEDEPAVAAALVAGQRSREQAHAAVLARLGLEPLLDLRLRAGEGVGACLGAQLLVTTLRARRSTARTGSARLQ